jgi:acyl dehydratase
MINKGLIKAAFYIPDNNEFIKPLLPETNLTREIQINALHCEQYNRLVNWKPGITSVIHPNYLQVLTLPMQLAMVTHKPFPFKPMGLVHLANNIEVNFLPTKTSKLTLKTSFAGLEWHKKGWVFAVLSEGMVDEKLAISGKSFYLSRQQHASREQLDNELYTAELSEREKIEQKRNVYQNKVPSLTCNINGFDCCDSVLFPLGIGRRYAHVSGDYNPIHLTRWTAKLMGFKQAIAHGMYSKAICLSQVMKHELTLGQTCPPQGKMLFTSQFIQPIYLPTNCELRVSGNNVSTDSELNGISTKNKSIKEIEFSLVSKVRSKYREHLRTQIVIG